MTLNIIDGTADNDLLNGTLLDDLINAGAGNDTINAAGGDDVVNAGAGDDSVVGAKGNDTLNGGNGNDIIVGGDGNDELNGNAGDDIIIGGNDADLIRGGNGNDNIVGGGGNDTIRGDAGDDTIVGSLDDDIIDGGTGNDSIKGNLGNDILLGGAGDDTIQGGDGNERIYGDNYIPGTYVELGENLVVNGSFEHHGTLTKGHGTWDELSTLEGWTTNAVDGMEVQAQVAKFGAAADGHVWLELDSDSNQIAQDIDTTAGEQYQVSFEYSPRKGTNGDSNRIQVLWNGEVIATIGKGGGEANTWKTHTFMVDASEGDTTGLEFRYVGDGGYAGAFIDDVKVQQVTDEPLLQDFGSGDTFGNDEIDAGAGNDTVFGNQGNDTIRGGDGDDSIRANAGDDSLFGNKGDDFIDGQAGNDTVLGGNGDDYLKGGSGNDLVQGDDGNDGIWGGAGDDTLEGGNGDDLIDDTRGGDDCLFGGEGNDTLYSGDDNDIVSGGNGDDKLFGDKGDDTVVGGAGNDVVNGGQGNDLLYGDNVTSTLGDNLVVNGSFEHNSVHYNCRGVFQTIEGWTTTMGSGIEIKEEVSKFGAAADGHAWVELDSHSNSGMVQHIDTTVGQHYQVSFDYKARRCVSENSNGIEVYWNGEKLDTIAQSGYHQSNLSWQTYTYTVDASVDVTALEFRAVGHSDYRGGFIDDVKVQQVFKPDMPNKIGTEQVAGCDLLRGGDGNDTMYGGAANDTLFGGAGNDILNGTDRVSAGFNEEDRLNGGSGHDTFVLGDSEGAYYNARGWQDCAIVEDFNQHEDTVQLNGSSDSYWLQSFGNGNSYLWQWNGGHWDGVAMFENAQLDNHDLETAAFEYA